MDDQQIIEEQVVEKEELQESTDTEESPTEETAGEISAEQSLQKIKDFTEEDEVKSTSKNSFRSIIGGEFLTAKLVKDQLPLIIVIALCFVIYISRRYTNQAELIEIDNLKKELDDARFNALTRSSELTAKSRQSYVEEFLKNSKDSLLEISSNSPYVIKLNGESILPDAEEGDSLPTEKKSDSIIVE